MPLPAALPGIVAHHAGMRIHCDAPLRAFKAAKAILAYACLGLRACLPWAWPHGITSLSSPALVDCVPDVRNHPIAEDAIIHPATERLKNFRRGLKVHVRQGHGQRAQGNVLLHRAGIPPVLHQVKIVSHSCLPHSARDKVTDTSPLPRASAHPVRSSIWPSRV